MNSENETRLKRPKRNYFHSQYTAGAAIFLASATNGTLSGWATACLPLLVSTSSPVKMNSEEISWVMSIQFIGYMISAIPAGLLMDKYGSKIPLIIFSFLLPIPSLLLIYITNNWKILSVSRFLSGFWVGIVNTIGPMYLSEISEPNIRGFINTMYNVSFRIGNIYALTSALFISYKYLPLFYSITIVLFIVIYPLIPESPYYYMKRNDKVLAKQSISWLRHNKNDIEIDNELKELEISVRKQMENSSKFIDLISTKGNRKALLIVETLAILQKLAGLTSVFSYLSITLPKSISLEPSMMIIIIEIFRLISSLISSFIIDRVGSRFLLFVTSIFCGFMMFMTGLWYFFDSKLSIDLSNYNWIPFLCITMHGISFNLGLNSVSNTIRSELFPVNIKGKCSALTCTSTALVSFLASKIYLVIDKKLGAFINFWIYSISSFSIALFSTRFYIETTGKSLHEIQDELNKSKIYTTHL